MERELLLKCLKVMNKAQKKKVKGLEVFEKYYSLCLKAKTEKQVEKVILTIVKEQEVLKPTLLSVYFDDKKQNMISGCVRKLVYNGVLGLDVNLCLYKMKDTV